MRRSLATAVACALLAGCRGADESHDPRIWQRDRQPSAVTGYAGAALLDDGWIACVDSPAAVVPRIALRHDSEEADAQPILATVVGTNPSLVRLNAATLGLLYRAMRADGRSQFLFRRFETGPSRLGRATRVTSTATTPLAGNARLVHTATGALVFPVAELDQPGSLGTANVVLYVSTNGGGDWVRQPLALGRPALAPAVVEMPTRELVLIVNCLGILHRAVSTDGGAHWGALESLGLAAQESPHTLCRLAETPDLLLAWTEAQPHEREVAPTIRALRLASSVDAGRTWSPPHSLVVRPGWLPTAPALVASADALHLILEVSRPPQHVPLVLDIARHTQDATDPRRARDNLRVLVAHAIERNERESVLFVESSLMRMLVAAHEALAPFAAEHADWLQTERGVTLARDYADELVQKQQPSGYWSIGYKSRFVADMAVGIGLFRALAPHVDSTRRQRYLQAATRFVAALERDGFFLANGAVGVGRAEGEGMRVVRTPYIVSTALAGAAARAWLYAETHEEAYRQGCLASLRWLASQVAADGSVPGFEKEPPLIAAAYMGDGWMAALPLADAAAAGAMAPAFARHVQWLLRTQAADGSWGEVGSGVRERAPLLVNFLVWAEQQSGAPSAVHDAARRGLATLDFDAWRRDGVFAPGMQVYRAMAGIPLAAFVSGAPVF